MFFTNLYETTDTFYSKAKFLEPAIDAHGNIFAMLNLSDIAVGTETDSIFGFPQTYDFTYYLIKMDSLFTINQVHSLGMESDKESFGGLILDNFGNPYVLKGEWSQYSGSGVQILGFDPDLNNFISIDDSTMFYTPGCWDVNNNLSAIDIDHEGRIVCAAYNSCDCYPCEPDLERNFLLQIIDTSGIQYSYKKYDLVDNRIMPDDILKDNFSNDIYSIAHTNTGFGFETDTIAPNSIFVLKHSEGLSGLADIKKSFHVSIFPNPATSSLTIQSDHPLIQISLYNTHGEKIFSSCTKQPVSSIQYPTTNINLSSQPKGIYFLEVFSEYSRVVKKIVLE